MSCNQLLINLSTGQLVIFLILTATNFYSLANHSLDDQQDGQMASKQSIEAKIEPREGALISFPGLNMVASQGGSNKLTNENNWSKITSLSSNSPWARLWALGHPKVSESLCWLHKRQICTYNLLKKKFLMNSTIVLSCDFVGERPKDSTQSCQRALSRASWMVPNSTIEIDWEIRFDKQIEEGIFIRRPAIPGMISPLLPGSASRSYTIAINKLTLINKMSNYLEASEKKRYTIMKPVIFDEDFTCNRLILINFVVMDFDLPIELYDTMIKGELRYVYQGDLILPPMVKNEKELVSKLAQQEALLSSSKGAESKQRQRTLRQIFIVSSLKVERSARLKFLASPDDSKLVRFQVHPAARTTLTSQLSAGTMDLVTNSLIIYAKEQDRFLTLELLGFQSFSGAPLSSAIQVINGSTGRYYGTVSNLLKPVIQIKLDAHIYEAHHPGDISRLIELQFRVIHQRNYFIPEPILPPPPMPPPETGGETSLSVSLTLEFNEAVEAYETIAGALTAAEESPSEIPSTETLAQLDCRDKFICLALKEQVRFSSLKARCLGHDGKFLGEYKRHELEGLKCDELSTAAPFGYIGGSGSMIGVRFGPKWSNWDYFIARFRSSLPYIVVVVASLMFIFVLAIYLSYRRRRPNEDEVAAGGPVGGGPLMGTDSGTFTGPKVTADDTIVTTDSNAFPTRKPAATQSPGSPLSKARASRILPAFSVGKTGAKGPTGGSHKGAPRSTVRSNFPARAKTAASVVSQIGGHRKGAGGILGITAMASNTMSEALSPHSSVKMPTVNTMPTMATSPIKSNRQSIHAPR